MKYNKQIGIIACVILIVACFLPWAYYADINKVFTGFFSEKNAYGKPGKFLTFFALISIYLIFTPKVWAKRTHLFFAALTFGYAIKTYTLYTSCYNAYCPEKRLGIFLMVFCCAVILVVSIFPDLKIGPSQQSSTKPVSE